MWQQTLWRLISRNPLDKEAEAGSDQRLSASGINGTNTKTSDFRRRHAAVSFVFRPNARPVLTSLISCYKHFTCNLPSVSSNITNRELVWPAVEWRGVHGVYKKLSGGLCHDANQKIRDIFLNLNNSVRSCTSPCCWFQERFLLFSQPETVSELFILEVGERSKGFVSVRLMWLQRASAWHLGYTEMKPGRKDLLIVERISSDIMKRHKRLLPSQRKRKILFKGSTLHFASLLLKVLISIKGSICRFKNF